MNHEADYHEHRECQERECAGKATSAEARAIHFELADRHAGQARRLHEEAAALAQVIHNRLIREAAAESERIAIAATERRKRALKSIGVEAGDMVNMTTVTQVSRTA